MTNTEKSKELKEIETRANYLSLNSEVGVWDWFIKENRRYMSPTFKKMLGYEGAEVDDSFNTWKKIVYSEDLPALLDLFTQHSTSMIDIPFNVEVRFYHKNKDIIWIRCNGEVVERDKDLRPVRMIGTLINITLTKKADSVVSQKVKELKLKNSEFRQFAYVASHDLQEPLRIIYTYLEIIKIKYYEHIDDQGQLYLRRTIEGAKRMKSLISDLLKLSRLENNENLFESVSLKNIVVRVVKDMDLHLVEQNALINYGDLPEVKGNNTQLYQLFQNLISNSLKFSKDGVSPVIEINSVVDEGKVSIIFKDNGIGIEKKFHERIFQVFQRLHTREEYEGTGIGLALCRKIAQGHGGYISILSSTNGGTAFEIKLHEAETNKVSD